MSYFQYKKYFFLFIAGMVLAGFLPLSASAQNVDINAQIEALKKQVASLQEQLKALEQKTSTISPSTRFDGVHAFQTYLERGMNNGEVKNIQLFLKYFPDVYPEGLATGYFGIRTEKAVKRFQAAYGIEQVGVVGPRTRAQLNKILLQNKKEIVTPITPSSSEESPVSVAQFSLEPRPVYDTDALAQTIHAFINEERMRRGLFPLTWDWALAQVAFLHSADQARDNEELTDPDFLCHYPLIRHEGFVFGLTLKDRLIAKNIAFRSAGENIGMLPASKNLIYQYQKESPPSPCPAVGVFEPAYGTPEERSALYKSIRVQSLDAVGRQEITQWLNRSWYTNEEIARRIVDGWMDSPGHRENIVTPAFDSGGIGIVMANDYFIITHNFVDR